MSEAEAIALSQRGPVTIESLDRDFRDLGIEPGMSLLLHSSLSSMGWVCGGAASVILALEEVLRPFGTLVMPTHTGLSDPSGWENPPVPESWWQTIRDTMPAFDPDLTPSRNIGVIPELFRTQPGVLRSLHPQLSFAAWGEGSIAILENHSLDFGLGEESPLAKLYQREGFVLLLGVTHESNTSLHLGEIRANYHNKRVLQHAAPISVGNHRRWKQYQELDYDSSDFGSLGRDFRRDEQKLVRRGSVGYAEAELFPQRLWVDFAVRWIEKKRR